MVLFLTPEGKQSEIEKLIGGLKKNLVQHLVKEYTCEQIIVIDLSGMLYINNFIPPDLLHRDMLTAIFIRVYAV